MCNDVFLSSNFILQIMVETKNQIAQTYYLENIQQKLLVQTFSSITFVIYDYGKHTDNAFLSGKRSYAHSSQFRVLLMICCIIS